jgi:hypothetical protein
VTAEVFVRLPDEPVLVWRPVRAVHLAGDLYVIADQPYDRSVERWEFEPGERVVCRLVDSEDGPILAASSGAAS